jgi:hypothetical protein
MPDAQPPDPNAPDARPLCYAGGGTPTPGAEVVLGAFADGVGYTPLAEDDEMPVYAGPQGGHHFFVHARISGLSPGDREQPPETNPATWFTAYLEDGTDITQAPCVFPLAYELNADGEYQLPYPPILQIDSLQVPAIYNTRVRIKVEVMDGEGHYATDERWVIAVPQFAPDAGVPEPPPDAAAVLGN